MGGSFYLCTFCKTVFWDTTKGKEAQHLLNSKHTTLSLYLYLVRHSEQFEGNA